MTAEDAKLDLAAINPMLMEKSPQQIIEWAHAQFGEDLVMTSSFGAESATLIHLATQFIPSIKILFVDTGYLFPETHAFMETLRLRFNLNVWTFRTKQDPIRYLHDAGEDNFEWRKDVDRCCAVNKEEPTQRALQELKPKAWMRGVRSNQTSLRKGFQIVDWSQRDGCYAISPILRWTTKDIYTYMKQNNLPYHPLYEKGYVSIGCNPLSCTRPIQPGEDPRSGRWAGQNKDECGINVTTSLDSAQI